VVMAVQTNPLNRAALTRKRATDQEKVL